MAKAVKKAATGLTAAELREVETIESAIAREESRTVDERVSDVFAEAEPASSELETVVDGWLREAREALAVWGAGEAVSPDVLKSLVSRAVGLLSR